MTLTAEAATTTSAAALHYFEGERLEMGVILAGSLGLALLAGVLYFISRDGFAKGVLVTVLLCAALMSSMAVSLLKRDAGLRTALTAAIQSPSAQVALENERKRVADIIDKYRYYRTGALVLALSALALWVLSSATWVHGAVVGVLLLVSSQIGIDHYSEQRARVYLAQLTGAAG